MTPTVAMTAGGWASTESDRLRWRVAGVRQIGKGWGHGVALQMELQGWEQRVCSLQGVAGEKQEQQVMARCAKRHLSGSRWPLGTTCSSAAALLALAVLRPPVSPHPLCLSCPCCPPTLTGQMPSVPRRVHSSESLKRVWTRYRSWPLELALRERRKLGLVGGLGKGWSLQATREAQLGSQMGARRC